MITPKYFKRKEFACKCGCGFDTVDVELLYILVDIRIHFGHPVIINSGCRCTKHNKSIGGSLRSQHVIAKAADIKVKGVHADKVADYLEEQFPGEHGIGRYKGRTHIDVREGCARWDNR